MNATRHALLLARCGLAAAGLSATALLAQQDPPAPTFTNVSVHDPSVVRDGSSYYVFGSHMASASTTDLMNVLITTSNYRMVSVALNALGVQHEPGDEPFPVMPRSQ